MQRISQRMDVNENTIEQFIRESPWDYEELHDHLASQIPCCIRDEKVAFIVDEVSLVNQGTHSVGVQRQYCGAQGEGWQLSGGRRSDVCGSWETS